MAGIAGRYALVKVSGLATAFTNEACTDSGDHQTYQIAATAKRVWDPTAPITVKVGGSVTGESYTLNRLTGKITFAAVDAGRAAVTVSGQYLPMAVAVRSRSYSFTLQATLADDTDFDTANSDGGFQRKIQALLDVSGSIGRKWDSDTVMRDFLLAGNPIVIEIFADRNATHELVCWALLSKSAVNMVLEQSHDADIDFQGTTDADGRAASQ